MSAFPPGPRGMLPGRALLSFPRHPEAFRRVALKHGDLSSFLVGAQRFFLINHPDLVREALSTKAASFMKGWGPVAGHSLLRNGLLTSEGALHQQQRRLMLPAMHRQRLEEYAEIVIRHGRELAENWPAGADVDVVTKARHVTLRVIGEALFGTDTSADAGPLTAALAVVFQRFAGRMHPFARLVRGIRRGSAAAGSAATGALRDYASALEAERRSRPGNDLLAMLLEARDESGAPLSKEQIVDEIVTFLIAGHETVALTLAWAWALLARNAPAQLLLHRELDTVLGDREPGWEDLRRLPYTHGVIAEAMRLYPPQWMLGRRAIERVEIGGSEVSQGAVVLVCLSILHRDGRWFDAPDSFRPERWSAGIDKSAVPFTFIPFGVATRRCVGEGFAWMEATLLLALMARRLRVAPVTSALRVDPLLLLRPENARLRFEKRQPQSFASASSIG